MGELGGEKKASDRPAPKAEESRDTSPAAPARRKASKVDPRVQAALGVSRGKQSTSPSKQTAVQAYGGIAPTDRTHDHATAGVEAASQKLPFADEIQRSFGRHDISAIKVAIGGGAHEASQAIGAHAYAVGDRIAFAQSPDLHTAAHEAAHVVQQRSGVSVQGGVGKAGDRYEQHANAVADRVVAGQSAEALLDEGASGGSAKAAVQKDSAPLTSAAYVAKHDAALVTAAHNAALYAPYAISSMYATLAKPHDFAVQALAGINTAQQMRMLLVPKKLEDIVDRVRVKDADEWSDSVGVVVGSALAETIHDSITRLVPRYLDARSQAALTEEAKTNVCPAVAPEPVASDLLLSHPMDRHVAVALCSGAIAFNVDEYRVTHPDAKPAKPPRKVEFTWDNATNGAYWIRVLDSEPARPEDVALTLFGATEQAFEITGKYPLFGFTHAQKLVEPHKSYLQSQGENLDAELDPTAALVDPANGLGPNADELAKAQGEGSATGQSRDEIVIAMRVNMSLLDDIAESASRFDLGDRVANAHAQLDAKSVQLKDPTTPYSEVAKWDGTVNEQNLALQRGVDGLAALVSQLDDLSKGMKELPPKFADSKLPEYIKTSLLKPVTAFVTGAAFCQLPATANAKFDEAERLAAFCSVEMLDGMLTEVMRVVRTEQEHSHSDDYAQPDTKSLAKREAVMRAELARIRTLLLTDSKAAGVALTELSAKIQDLSTEGELVENVDELDNLWTRIEQAAIQVAYAPSIDQSSAEAAGKRAAERKRALQTRSSRLYGLWKKAYDAWKGGNKDGAKKMMALLREDYDLNPLLTDCAQLFQDAEDIKAVNKIGALLGVTVLTMGVGAYVEGIAAGLELGTGGTILMVSGAETVTFVGLSQAFLDSDHSATHIITELGFNFVMFASLRRFSKMIEAAKLAAVTKAAISFTGTTVIATAMGLVKTEIETYARTGKHLSGTQVKQICIESLVQSVGMAIMAMPFSEILPELSSEGKELGATIKIANERGAALKKLKGLPKGATIEDADALIKQHRDWAEAKIKAYEALENRIEYEKLHPPKKGESVFDKLKLTESQIASLKQGTREAIQAMDGSAAMFELEPQGGNTYTCPSEKLPKVIERLGGSPVSEVKDAVTGLTTVKIKGPDGKTIKIIEVKVGPNAIASAETPVGAPVVDTTHLPESAQSIARWQTEGISQDAPDTWGKTSADGKQFKDVYAEWMRQPERIEKSGEHWKAVYPKDCPPEFKPLFDKIVDKGNVTMTTQGEANVAKLKADGIDLANLDPLSPEYLAQRDKIIKTMGKDAVERWEASKTQQSLDKGAAIKQINSVLAPEALAQLRSAFPDCEIVITGSISQTGKRLGPPKSIQDVDVILIVPKDTPMESRVAMEKRAAGIKLATNPEFQRAGGAPELRVDAQAMLPEEYAGVRMADPGKRTSLNDVRVDGKVAKAADVAKQYGLGEKPEVVGQFENRFERNPVEATQWANALKDVPGLGERLIETLKGGAFDAVRPDGSGLLDIHGFVKISPGKLGEIERAGDLAKLVTASERKGPETELEYFEGSRKYRLRFPLRLATTAHDVVATIAGDLPKNDPRLKIFDNVDADSQQRLWDLNNEGEFQSQPEIRKQASRWALSKSPKSVREFVAQWQFYIAEVGRRRQEIVTEFNAAVSAEQARIASTGAVPNQATIRQQLSARTEWFGKAISNIDKISIAARTKAAAEMGTSDLASGKTLGDERADSSLRANLDAQDKPGYEPGAKPTQAAIIDPVLRARSVADSLAFRDPIDAAYHAHKHAPEMINPPRKGQEAQELNLYLDEARGIVKNGRVEVDNGVRSAQNSARVKIVTFLSPTNGKVIVVVEESGAASISTYMPKT